MLGFWQSETNLLVWTRWTGQSLSLSSAVRYGQFPHKLNKKMSYLKEIAHIQAKGEQSYQEILEQQTT